MVVEDLGGVGRDPVPAVDAEAEHEPVGHVDDALVHHVTAGHLGREPVEHTGQIGTGVVGTVGVRLGERALRRHVTVAERAQRFALTLLGRLVPLV